MNRVRILGFLAGAMAFVALAVPGTALAGTYTWNLASDFSATPPGANPDHDSYGATPWSYEEGPASGSMDPSTFSLLPPPMLTSGGLSAWNDAGTGALVGVNPTGSSITALNATVPSHQIFVEPGSAGQVVAVGWTSPLSHTETVSINGSLTSDAPAPPACVPTTTWSVDENGVALPGASGEVPASFSTTATVAPGASIFLTVSTPPAEAPCDATGLQLAIQAGGVAPSVSLTEPVSGSSNTINNPTFSGGAGAGFGDAGLVTLRVYAGSVASGTPVETVTVPRSGATWSTTLPSPLPVGTYTAQAEQDDIATPADAGLSAPATFTVSSAAITLDSLGSAPLTTSTPTLSGVADTAAGSEPVVVVEIFRGTTTAGSPALRLGAPVAATGQFSVQVAPALADGTYTALVAQVTAAGNLSVSAPQTFSVDTHPPPVTLIRPATGARADRVQLVFTGAAGDASFDSPVVGVAVYRGQKATGTPIATIEARVTGATWSAMWSGALAPGVYTARASQGDAVGHLGLSAAHTFQVLPLPPVIGGATLNRAGRAGVKIACNEPPGDTCSGTVLILTRGEFQPLAGGPFGRLTVMFAYVRVPGGQMRTVTRMLLPSVAAVLRGHANVAVTISASLHPITGKAIHAVARGTLRRVRT